MRGTCLRIMATCDVGGQRAGRLLLEAIPRLRNHLVRKGLHCNMWQGRPFSGQLQKHHCKRCVACRLMREMT